jgi:ABC-type multidrug transport system fused ATPase/permease subunit
MTNDTNWKERLYKFFYTNLKITRPLALFKIDFQKPWWYVFKKTKWEILGTTVFNLLNSIFFAFSPVFIGFVISTRNYTYFYYYFLYWLILRIFILFFNPFWIRVYSRILASVKFESQNFFLKTDPINHTTRSSGQILAKVDRTKQAYDDIVSIVTEDLFPFLIKVFGASTTLFLIDTKIGLIGLAFFIVLVFLNSLGMIFNTDLIQPQIIKYDDLEKQVEVENLAQVAYIRSTFASQQQIDKSEIIIQKSFSNWNLKYRLYHLVVQLTTYPFMLFIAYICYYTINQIELEKISPALGIGVITSIILNTQDLLWIGMKVERLIKATIEADDLFKFIRGFGKQTFPVLKD